MNKLKLNNNKTKISITIDNDINNILNELSLNKSKLNNKLITNYLKQLQ
ncbi:MAG: hypothetical protein ACOCVF_01850 [bacterium]